MSWRKDKDQPRGERGYHHGNLKEALLQAALDLITQKGPAGFTFADAARMAGTAAAEERERLMRARGEAVTARERAAGERDDAVQARDEAMRLRDAALAARDELAKQNIKARVVSMPCWELFEAQDAGYRDEVLPPDVGARLSIEAGVALGWKQWVGDRGDSIALDRFGASAPGPTVLEQLGYSLDNVVGRATALLERVA